MLFAANHADRIHVQHQTNGTAVCGCLGIEDMGLTEAEIESLKPVRMLVEQVSEVGGRRMCRSDRQQHRVATSSKERMTAGYPSALAPETGFGSGFSSIADTARESAVRCAGPATPSL